MADFSPREDPELNPAAARVQDVHVTEKERHSPADPPIGSGVILFGEPPVPAQHAAPAAANNRVASPVNPAYSGVILFDEPPPVAAPDGNQPSPVVSSGNTAGVVYDEARKPTAPREESDERAGSGHENQQSPLLNGSTGGVMYDEARKPTAPREESDERAGSGHRNQQSPVLLPSGGLAQRGFSNANQTGEKQFVYAVPLQTAAEMTGIQPQVVTPPEPLPPVLQQYRPSEASSRTVTREWRYSLLSCCDDYDSCMEVTLFQPCQAARQVSYLHSQTNGLYTGELVVILVSAICWIPMYLYCMCMWCCCPINSICAFFSRKTVRRRYNISGTVCWDYIVTCCCTCCSFSQTLREMISMQESPGTCCMDTPTVEPPPSATIL